MAIGLKLSKNEEERPVTSSEHGQSLTFAITVIMYPQIEMRGYNEGNAIVKTLLQMLLRAVRFYYRYSPNVADIIRRREYLKKVVREGLKPLIWIAKQLVN